MAYDDGTWHHVSLTISKDKINFTIDTEVLIRALMSKFELSTYFLLGGGRSDMKGFIGCLKNVKIQESTLTMDSKGTVKLFFNFFGIQRINNDSFS